MTGWRRSLFYSSLLTSFHSINSITTHNLCLPTNKPNPTTPGQGLPNRLQCQSHGIKTHFSTAPAFADSVRIVTVFTLYNTTTPPHDVSNLVTVGNATYTKLERSMSVLNIFVNFIQVAMS